MSLVQQLKTIIGIDSTVTDYDELIIILATILMLYIIKSIFSFFYAIFKGN